MVNFISSQALNPVRKHLQEVMIDATVFKFYHSSHAYARQTTEIIKRGTVEIISKELFQKLDRSYKKRPLKVKAGLTPLPRISISTYGPARKMRHFQELGHELYSL